MKHRAPKDVNYFTTRFSVVYDRHVMIYIHLYKVGPPR